MRVIIAARLSQMADGQTGLDSQDEDAQAWADANDHEVIATLADVKSGTVAPWNRPHLRPWVTEAGLMASYDAVVCAKMDRLSRAEYRDADDIRRWAEVHGKKLVVVLDEDTAITWPAPNEDAQQRWLDECAKARSEWRAISRRYRRMQRRLRDGGALVGRPPFGYAVIAAEGGHKMLTPTETGRIIVPAIFQWCIDGDSMAQIAARLDALEVPTTAGKSWWARSVGSIIRCATYTGRRQDSDGRTIHRCEPLTDADTFRRANAALDSRPKRGPATGNRALLAEVIFCPRCADSPMYRITCGSGNQRRTLWYRCSGRGSQRRGCGNMVALDAADSLVSGFLAGFTAPVMEVQTIPGSNHAAELADVELELRQLPAQGLDEDAEDARRAELRSERKRLASLPSEPDRVMMTDTGRTYAAEWAELAGQARGAWLRSHAVKVFALKSDAGSMGELLAARDIMPDTAAVVAGAGVTVGIAWA